MQKSINIKTDYNPSNKHCLYNPVYQAQDVSTEKYSVCDSICLTFQIRHKGL